jgi:hypothetical protein
MIKRMAKRLAMAGVLTVVAGGFAATQAEPALASTCPTAGCGGVVRMAGAGELWVSNCWSGSAGTYAGAQPPCVQIVSQNKVNASWFVTKGHTSTQLGKYYYDVDSYQATGGCVTRGQQSGSTFSYDRRGKSGLWIKISSATKDVVVTSIAC